MNQRENKQYLKIPRMMFAAPASGSGKTMMTCGFLEVLRRRQKRVISFKCGPDYIDPIFHQYVLGIPSCNLDSFFLPEDEVRELFFKKAAEFDAEYAVLEGVMGFYDGVAGISTKASSYEIAGITDTPVILIVDGKKSSLSAAALVKGFCEYRTDSRIAGVILNRTSPAMGERLKPELEKLGVRYCGCMPECQEVQFESRHLGLTLPQEQKWLREKIGMIADQMEKYLDVDGICQLAETASAGYRPAAGSCRHPEGILRSMRIAAAKDEAFCFYYQDNLDVLRELGCEIIPFSPLHDTCLPERIQGILLGGGYPECYAKELSENHKMLQAIRTAADQGVRILAECGGFLYLHRTLEGMDGNSYPMAGILDAEAYRTDRLTRFGYISLCQNADKKDLISDDSGKEGLIRAHEFHYWDSSAPGKAMTAKKPMSARSWMCMHSTGTLLAGFPHLYYRSGAELICSFLKGGMER